MTLRIVEQPLRSRFIVECLNRIHMPYLWGGRTETGVDCWGLVALAYAEAGGQRLAQWWTDIAWNTLPPVEGEPLPGDLAFYGGTGPKDVSHVMVLLGMGLIVGASGGDARVKSWSDAVQRDARVKVFPDLAAYAAKRKDFRGYRRLPFRGE